MLHPLVSTLAALALVPGACAAEPPNGRPDGGPDRGPDGPPELGRVRWERDLDAALARAGDEGRPVFALFQEIPGCATCRDFGAGPLSEPLLVEAIEDLFVPLAVYNNRPGADAEVLRRYGEPSWNNPVVRYLDAEGRDLVERRDRVWSTGGVAARTVGALERSGGDAPRWLELLAAERGPGLAEATFAMVCFWQGEARLGALDGVVGTRAGWLDGREVVVVRYDPRRIDAARLEQEARRASCTRVDGRGGRGRAARAARDARAADRRYFLRPTPYAHLPLTPAQQTKVNAELARGGDPGRWLSPRQRLLLERVRAAEPGRLAGLYPPETDDGTLADYDLHLRRQLDRSPDSAAR